MRQSHEICRVIQDMIASRRHRWFPQLTASETQIISSLNNEIFPPNFQMEFSQRAGNYK